MSPSPADPLPAPIAIPASSAPSQYASLRIDEPDTTASGTQRGQALYDSPPAGSQPTPLLRSQRTRTPTERGRQFKDDIQRSQALSTKIQQAKARKSRSQDEGRGPGQRKRNTPTPPSDACLTDNGDDDGDDDDEAGTSSEWIVDDSSDEVVPTSDAGELELDDYTYQSELEDHSFRKQLTERIDNLLKGEFKTPSRKTLKEILKLVRRDQTASLGASQEHSPVLLLPAQELDGGGGHHLNYAPQPAQKRRLGVPQPGPLKRGRLDLSPTPSTVLDVQSPPPTSEAVFADPLDPMRPAGLPESNAGPGAIGRPPGLPVSAAPKGPPQAAHELSPSPLPANFQFQLDDTQTQPEDTQTQPEDTQTQPENTQTQVSDSRSNHTVPSLPQSTQPRIANSLPQPASQPCPSSAQFTLFEPGYSIFQPGSTARATSGPGRSVNSDSRSRQLADLSKRFDTNARHRAHAQAISKKRAGNLQGSTFDYNEPMEDDTEAIAEAQNAAAAKPSGLNCQPGRPRQIASSAIVDVTAYSFARGAYETRLTNLIWGLEAYERRWKAEAPGHLFEPAMPELIKEIINRIPSGRTAVKSNIRAVIKRQYDFILIPKTQQDIDANLKQYEKIKEDFHMESPDKPRTHYEHPALQEAFLEGLFDASHSPCVVFHEYFNPVPVETIAFVLTMMDACIREWRSGQEVTENLNSKEQSVMYVKHLHNLGRFASRAPVRLNRIRREWYAAASLKSVRTTEPEAETQATIRFEDIREDTPQPGPDDAEGSGNGSRA